jgi:type IX secretion system PorP/SprF family membrane protein
MRNKTLVIKFYFIDMLRNAKNWCKYIILPLVLLGSSMLSFSQDATLSQYFSAPLHLNPALAGVSYGPRVTLNYRNQWSSLGSGFNGGFTTYMAGFDMYIEKIRGGIGAMFQGDQIAGGLFGTYQAKIIYSQQIKLNKRLALKVGLEGTYIHTQVKWNQLLWSDMINPITGFYGGINVPNPTAEPAPQKLSTDKGDMSAGMLLFSEKLYLGFVVNNLLRHDQSFFGDQSAVTPMEFLMHFGANWPIKKMRDGRNNIWVSPNVLLVNQGKDFQVEGTFLAGISFIYFGLGYRNVIYNSDAIIGYLGFKKGKFRFGYSYDDSISKLAKTSGGTHELSFTFNWTGEDNSLNPKSHKAYMPCPDILNF